MLRFVTYGDDKFSESRVRISKEAQSLNFFDVTSMYTEKDIKKTEELNIAIRNPEFSKVFKSVRGGGYWMWKPLVIYEELKKMNNNDILFYSDAGLVIPSKPETIKKFREYSDTVRDHETGILTWRNPHIESTWTKADVFNHFNALNDEQIHSTRQNSGGRQVIRKCKQSMEIIKLWWETAVNYPHLFSDAPSKIPNFDDFIENRHDQSVWSMIAKKYNVFQNYNWEDHAIKLIRIKR